MTTYNLHYPHNHTETITLGKDDSASVDLTMSTDDAFLDRYLDHDNAVDGDEYTQVWQHNAVDSKGNSAVVVWHLPVIKGEEPELAEDLPWSNENIHDIIIYD